MSAPRRLSGLAREILVILTIKALVLFGIGWMWFSAPEAKHMRMPTQRVLQRLIEAPVAPDSPQTSHPGAPDHASR